jgi:Transcriptional regulator, AbiEi antitoxin
MTRTPGLNAERLRRVLAAQHDLISSAQAHACGLTRKALASRLRREGPWQRLLPGVYLAVNGVVTQQQREMAALLYAGPRSVITGPAAVRRHGLTSAGPNIVDVLVPISVRRQSAGFVRLHRTARMPQRYFAVGQIRFARPARAVADAARSFTRFDEVRAVVCQAVQRGKCTVHELTEELNAGPNARSALLREALAEIRDGVRSVAEADFRRLVLNSGLPKPMLTRSYLMRTESSSPWWMPGGRGQVSPSRLTPALTTFLPPTRIAPPSGTIDSSPPTTSARCTSGPLASAPTETACLTRSDRPSRRGWLAPLLVTAYPLAA